MNECGVDPGIDHMSTMEIIERLRDDKSEILSYESFTGGILAPESPLEISQSSSSSPFLLVLDHLSCFETNFPLLG